MRRALWMLSLIAGLPACSSKQNNTKIVVVVWSDLTVPTEMDKIRIAAKGTTPSSPADFPLTGKTDLPVVLVLVPPDNQGLPFDVTATGYLKSNAIVSQAAHLSFVHGKSLRLTLFLGRACQGKPACDEYHTCSNGSCDRPIDVDPNDLPDYDPKTTLSPPDAGVGPGLDGGADVGAADVGRAETGGVGGVDAMADGRETGDSAADKPVDVPVSAPDSGVDMRDGGGDTGAGGTGGSGGADGAAASTGGAGGGGGVGGGGGSGGKATGGTVVVTGGAAAATGGTPATGGATAATGGATTASGGTAPTGGTAATGGTIGQSGGTTAATGGTTGSPASLSALPLSLGFGSVAISQSSGVKSFTVTNGGQQTSGAITLASSSAEFAIQTGASGDCVSGVTTLAGNASCTVRIVFTPIAVAARSETISFAATPGGGGSVSVTGAGIGGPEPAPEPPPEPAPEPAPDAAMADAPRNCIQRFKANGYSLGTDASIAACSDCKNSVGGSLEQVCKAMIDCLQPFWPCPTTDICWTNCGNTAGADQQGKNCVFTLTTAACR